MVAPTIQSEEKTMTFPLDVFVRDVLGLDVNNPQWHLITTFINSKEKIIAFKCIRGGKPHDCTSQSSRLGYD